jgi:hypothetical protein
MGFDNEVKLKYARNCDRMVFSEMLVVVVGAMPIVIKYKHFFQVNTKQEKNKEEGQRNIFIK